MWSPWRCSSASGLFDLQGEDIPQGLSYLGHRKMVALGLRARGVQPVRQAGEAVDVHRRVGGTQAQAGDVEPLGEAATAATAVAGGWHDGAWPAGGQPGVMEAA